MKKMFSILVVLISLISTNFVYSEGTIVPGSEVSASVYWNFVVLDKIESMSINAVGNYNLVAGSELIPPSGYQSATGENTLSTGFSPGTDGYDVEWTIAGSNSVNYTSYINNSTGTSVGLSSNGATIFFKIIADTEFGDTDPNTAYCDIVITKITSDANKNGSETFTWTITCDYDL